MVVGYGIVRFCGVFVVIIDLSNMFFGFVSVNGILIRTSNLLICACAEITMIDIAAITESS